MKSSSLTHKKERALSLEFSAREFPKYEKNNLWYVGLGILTLGLLFLSLQSRNYLMIAVILAALLAILSLSNSHPRSRTVKLTERGVSWGDEFFGYHQIKAFWVAKNGTNSAIYLERLNFAPSLHLTVPESQINAAVALLGLYLPFHHHRNEPFSDTFNRLLKI